MEGGVAHGLLPWRWVPCRPAEHKLIPVFLYSLTWKVLSPSLSAARLGCPTLSPWTLCSQKKKETQRFEIWGLLYVLIYIHTAGACAHTHTHTDTHMHTHTHWHPLCGRMKLAFSTVKNVLTWFPLLNAPWCVWQVSGCDLWRWKCFNWWRCLGYERSLQVARNRGEGDRGTERQNHQHKVPLPTVLSDPVTLLFNQKNNNLIYYCFLSKH